MVTVTKGNSMSGNNSTCNELYAKTPPAKRMTTASMVTVRRLIAAAVIKCIFAPGYLVFDRKIAPGAPAKERIVATPPGFEPGISAPKADVLPLHYGAFVI